MSNLAILPTRVFAGTAQIPPAAAVRATLRQAVVLVGGQGTRLGALVASTPKPMLAVGGRPFLGWLLRELCRYGVEEVVLLAGHLAPTIVAALPALRAGLPRPLHIVVVTEATPAGTGGALVRARGRLDARMLVCNGDTLFDTNLGRLLADAAADGPDIAARMLLRPMPDTGQGRYGRVRVQGGRVASLNSDGAAAPADAGAINTGILVMSRAMLEGAPDHGNLERDVLAPWVASGRVMATVADGWFCDIGLPHDLARARAELPARLHRPALILDRDGTLNVDHGYVGSRDRFDWMPGARAAVAAAGDRGWHVFVATNQSGVARGRYDEAAVRALHAWMDDSIRASGGTVDDWRFCPYHEDASVQGYRQCSPWRKPGPGMLQDLMRAWALDPARCVMVGDQPSDIGAAQAAGIAGHLFTTGDLHSFVTGLLDNSPVMDMPPSQTGQV